ncbi:vomeronasal type-1 receptor 4-like [Grammomys surdaster]|uniref:vomeronasal type-1 receptor 4-like n=1 Tax=Grammomys surdaster TaxID=491861 RepID=UPI0010A03BF5|nr:vomeronasal type-1 receptor 4-like [Grammomys surdaster]
MDFWNMTIKIIFLSQITTGLLINFYLLIYYLVYYREHKLRPTDLILMHLMAANALIVLSTGVPYTTAAFGLKEFFKDFGCRLILYIQRVGRSVSFGTTFLLNVFQAITISHRESCCKDQNGKAAKYIGCSICLLWVFYMFMHFIFFVDIFAKRNSNNVTRNIDYKYCIIVSHDDINESLYAALVICPEVLYSVLIGWSSGSMVVILYRHKQRVKHIHSSHVSSRNSPESRATKNILALVSSFLCFNTVSSILNVCNAFVHHHSLWLTNITHFTCLCFPSFGPFILMNHYSVMPRLSLVLIMKKNPNCILNI